MARVLYLSTDGLTDPLGRSQIIPYLEKLSALGHAIHIVSLEKPKRAPEVARLNQTLAGANLKWTPLPYHKHPPILATVFDLWRLRKAGMRIGKEERIDIIHARSYLAGRVALQLKQRLNARLLFDARGFWIDERLEGRIWNANNLVYRFIVWWFRKIELKLFTTADAVVLLTERAKTYLSSSKLKPRTPWVEVIPCCADEHFFDRSKISTDELENLRANLGITPSDIVIMYHGSLGTWYLIDELINFFDVFQRKFPTAKLLLVTNDNAETVQHAWGSKGYGEGALLTYSADREEMPVLLALTSLCVFFIKPVFSKTASSPTKMAEIIFMDVPLVTNSGIGDADELLKPGSGAHLIHQFSLNAYREVVNQLTLPKEDFRYPQELKNYFSLTGGVDRYHNLYLKLSNQSKEVTFAIPF